MVVSEIIWITTAYRLLQPSHKNKASTDTGVPAEALAKAGGGAGNRTRVRRSYTEGVYMLVSVFGFNSQSLH